MAETVVAHLGAALLCLGVSCTSKAPPAATEVEGIRESEKEEVVLKQLWRRNFTFDMDVGDCVCMVQVISPTMGSLRWFLYKRGFARWGS